MTYFSSLLSLHGLLPPRTASPLWPLPSNRATTRWSLSYWKMILKARSACQLCTLLLARMTPSQPPCSSRTTTMPMSSRRYAQSTLWPPRLGMCASHVVPCFCGNGNTDFKLCEAVVGLRHKMQEIKKTLSYFLMILIYWSSHVGPIRVFGWEDLVYICY